MAEEGAEGIFPEAEVVAAIEHCWEIETAGPPAEGSGKPGSIMNPLVEIDSHGVVRCLAAIDKATGIDIPETEAKDAGYDNLEDLIANLVPLARKYFKKQKVPNAKPKSNDADSGA